MCNNFVEPAVYYTYVLSERRSLTNLKITFKIALLLIYVFTAMVMADVTVLTDLWQEEEKRIKKLLEQLGQKMKDHGVCTC